ncbi:MAG: hypothetical protein LBP31_00740 [Holosporales bacterium]|jgi:hypothetical protein|nr:hypothetical protein [Holosporales bacterium]
MRKLILFSIIGASFLHSVGFCDPTAKIENRTADKPSSDNGTKESSIKILSIENLTGTDVERFLEKGVAFNGVSASLHDGKPVLHLSILMDNTGKYFLIISEKVKNSKDGSKIDLSNLINSGGLEILRDLFKAVSVDTNLRNIILKFSSIALILNEEYLKKLGLENVPSILNQPCFMTLMIRQDTGEVSLSTNNHMLDQIELRLNVCNAINNAIIKHEELDKGLERKESKVHDSIIRSEALKKELESLKSTVEKAEEDVSKNPAIARCDQLEREIAQLEGEMTATASQISTLQSAVSSLQSEYNTKSTAATAKRATTAQKNAANDAKARLNAKQNELNGAMNTKTAQEKKLNEFKTEKASLTPTVETLKKSFEEKKQKLDKLQKELADIEKNDNVVAYRVAKIENEEESKIIDANLKEQINELIKKRQITM